MKKKLFTVYVFSKINTKRFFRDRMALFFGILFPVIFLFVFGAISGGNANNVSFNIAIFNDSKSAIAGDFVDQINKSSTFKVDKNVINLQSANDKMSKSQLDAAIILPANFGTSSQDSSGPSGQAKVIYTQNNQQAGQTIISILTQQFSTINSQFVSTKMPFSVVGEQTNTHSLTAFDYTFAGLLGFAIVGIGIFGPVNVFPELKKQGILRRLHTTPLKVWQYFTSTMISQAIIGLLSLSVMFVVAILVFHLKVVGNYFAIAAFLILSIIMILGIGLAIGGWARNERQAAPLANIIIFPMFFLSGTFFPRFLMPEWLQSISQYLPLTPIIDGARLIVTEGKTLFEIGPQLGLIALWTLVIYILAFKVFRWE